MVEIPNNVLLIDEFSQHFDGFSIGSNDLTQLVLGVDRDSSVVAHEFDERDPGVLKIVAMAIEGARRNQRHISLCGEAPSDNSDFAEFLVQERIDAISLNPDAVMKTTLVVTAAEKRRESEHPGSDPMNTGTVGPAERAYGGSISLQEDRNGRQS